MVEETETVTVAEERLVDIGGLVEEVYENIGILAGAHNKLLAEFKDKHEEDCKGKEETSQKISELAFEIEVLKKAVSQLSEKQHRISLYK